VKKVATAPYEHHTPTFRCVENPSGKEFCLEGRSTNCFSRCKVIVRLAPPQKQSRHRSHASSFVSLPSPYPAARRHAGARVRGRPPGRSAQRPDVRAQLHAPRLRDARGGGPGRRVPHHWQLRRARQVLEEAAAGGGVCQAFPGAPGTHSG